MTYANIIHRENSIILEQFRIEKGKHQNHSSRITYLSTLEYRPYHASLSLQAIPIEIAAQTDMTNLWTYDLHNNSEGVQGAAKSAAATGRRINEALPGMREIITVQ
jgi:hypothetical protein